MQQRCIILGLALFFLALSWHTDLWAGQLCPGCLGCSPGGRGLAISPDGGKAYIGFEHDDSLLVVDLATFDVTASVDVSAVGFMLNSGTARFSPDGSKVWVINKGSENVMVVNSATNTVEKVLAISGWSLEFSQDGTKVYISTTSGELYVVDTTDYSFDVLSIPAFYICAAVPSPSNPDLIYGISTLTDQGSSRAFLLCDLKTHTVLKTEILPSEASPSDTGINGLIIDPHEKTAYFGWRKFIDSQGYGNLSAFDLENFELVTSTAMDYGVQDFALNPQTAKIYVIGFGHSDEYPGSLPIIEWDTGTCDITSNIWVSPSSDQRAIAIDPTDSNYLYMTEGDQDLLRKVDIATGEEVQTVFFHREELSPMTLIPGDDTAYVACLNSSVVFKLDLITGRISGSISLPSTMPEVHVGGYYQGHLYFSSGQFIYEIDPSDGSLVRAYDIGMLGCFQNLTFFHNKMVTIDTECGTMVGRRLLFFDAGTMQLLKSVDLPAEEHGDRVIVSPDASKLYVTRGTSIGGATTVTIIDGDTLETSKAITIPTVDIFTRGVAHFVDGYFDEVARRLYLLGWGSVYVIHMDTDVLLDILDTNVSQQFGGPAGGWSATALSGISVDPKGEKLLVVSADSHCIYIYDLVNSKWLPEILNLQGYFPTDATASPDRRYLYTANRKTDSITMVNASTRQLVKVITLPPTVISTSPAKNATNVAVNTTIAVIFSKAMDSSTITTDTFLVNDGLTDIAGTLTTVTQSGTIATFTPEKDLDYETTYTATITTGAKDSSGNPVEDDYEWSFTTVSETPTDGGGGGGGGG